MRTCASEQDQGNIAYCARRDRQLSFVFIHPMSDGNGRISRFLVNDILRRDGAVPEPFILPISATITNSTHERVGYDRVLERFSRPIMRTFADAYRFEAMVEYGDGVRSNFHFDAYDDASLVWRYPDLTAQAAYLGHVVQITIENEMGKEALFLRDIDRARAGVKEYRSILRAPTWRSTGSSDRCATMAG